MLPSYTAPATRIVFKGESDTETQHTSAQDAGGVSVVADRG
jgi:hypothetical protein